MTNLDKMKLIFPKADFNTNEDSYSTNTRLDRYVIQWIENEIFVVDRIWFDRDVGYVDDTDLYSGNFDECLEYIKQREGL